MDFAGVNTVVNFDFPGSTTDYIHRVGRTGRAGRAGEAVTFFTEDDSGKVRGVANVMRAAGCEVPEWMLQLKKDPRWRARAGVEEEEASGKGREHKGKPKGVEKRGGKRAGGGGGGGGGGKKHKAGEHR